MQRRWAPLTKSGPLTEVMGHPLPPSLDTTHYFLLRYLFLYVKQGEAWGGIHFLSEIFKWALMNLKNFKFWRFLLLRTYYQIMFCVLSLARLLCFFHIKNHSFGSRAITSVAGTWNLNVWLMYSSLCIGHWLTYVKRPVSCWEDGSTIWNSSQKSEHKLVEITIQSPLW